MVCSTDPAAASILAAPQRSRMLPSPAFFLFFSSPAVSTCATSFRVATMGFLASISPSMRPLLAALPKSCGSNGTMAIGVMPSGSAKSWAEISGRLGMPVWLRMSFGGGSFGRSLFSMSTRFLVLRRLASSGIAVMTISSALVSVFFDQPLHMWGRSSTRVGALRWAVSMMCENASVSKS